VARPWGNIARKAAGPTGYWLVLALITFLGLKAVIKIEATGTRLFLVLVVLSVAFGAASLLEHLVRDYVPTDIQRKHSKARERQNMRMMLKILIPTETGNHAIKDGSLHRIFETTMSKINPEAAYFVAEHGQRCAMMFFNMNDASDIPGIAEPLFAGLNAKIQLLPAMNAEDLKRGLDIAKQAM
jgi:hypothetical protein